MLARTSAASSREGPRHLLGGSCMRQRSWAHLIRDSCGRGSRQTGGELGRQLLAPRSPGAEGPAPGSAQEMDAPSPACKLLYAPLFRRTRCAAPRPSWHATRVETRGDRPLFDLTHPSARRSAATLRLLWTLVQTVRIERMTCSHGICACSPRNLRDTLLATVAHLGEGGREHLQCAERVTRSAGVGARLPHLDPL
jgi:hypothetical protein